MNHKEYSSSGSEYFPTGQEFSSAPPEFPRLSPEIRPAAAEIDQSGSEYQQTAGGAKAGKRHRRITPAMLTTAAVVTAAVAVIPLSSSIRGSLPPMELTAQSKAYLDEVWEALPMGDAEQLIELAGDERLRTLALDEVVPYLDELDAKYDIHDSENCEICSSTEYAFTEGFHDHVMCYDGQTAGYITSVESDQLMYFHYDSFAFSDQPDNIHRGVYFDRLDYGPEGDTFDGYLASVYFDNSDEHDYVHVGYETGHWEQEEFEGNSYYVLKNGYVYNYSKSEYVSGNFGVPTTDVTVYTAEGEFATKLSPSDQPEYSYMTETYLNNGIITSRQTSSNFPERNYSVEMEVIDGMIQLADGMFIEYDETNGYYHLCLDLTNPATGVSYYEYLYSAKVGSEEEFLQSLNWYIADSSYYLID